MIGYAPQPVSDTPSLPAKDQVFATATLGRYNTLKRILAPLLTAAAIASPLHGFRDMEVEWGGPLEMSDGTTPDKLVAEVMFISHDKLVFKKEYPPNVHSVEVDISLADNWFFAIRMIQGEREELFSPVMAHTYSPAPELKVSGFIANAHGDSVRLSWQASNSDSVVGYRIIYWPSAVDGKSPRYLDARFVDITPGDSFVIDTLPAGNYSFTIRAKGGDGRFGEETETELQGDRQPAPSAPNGFRLAEQIEAGKVEVRFHPES